MDYYAKNHFKYDILNRKYFFLEEPFIILFLIYGNEHLYQLNSEYAVVKEPLMSM